MTVKPVAATAVYQGAVSSGYAPAKPASWIDCKSAGVSHYGLKYCWANDCPQTQYIDTYITYWVEFREPN